MKRFLFGGSNTSNENAFSFSYGWEVGSLFLRLFISRIAPVVILRHSSLRLGEVVVFGCFVGRSRQYWPWSPWGMIYQYGTIVSLWLKGILNLFIRTVSNYDILLGSTRSYRSGEDVRNFKEIIKEDFDEEDKEKDFVGRFVCFGFFGFHK
jgi:hypothetical protein